MANASILLQAALNGNRDHPAVPRTPEELARDARVVVEAGARSLHLHAYDEHGRETLAARPCAAALRAVRAACPGVPLSLTTSASVEPDPDRRRALIAAWTELPDLVTANMGEAGIVESLLVLARKRERGKMVNVCCDSGLATRSEKSHQAHTHQNSSSNPRRLRAGERGESRPARTDCRYKVRCSVIKRYVLQNYPTPHTSSTPRRPSRRSSRQTCSNG